jgi:acyl-CoA synthetase (AMP-forming)/AMP-acid ligase II
MSHDEPPGPVGRTTIGALLDRAASRFGPREALVDGGVRLDFDAVRRRAGEAGRALVALGMSSGDRVALWLPNCADWIVLYLAVVQAGGILVPLNTSLTSDEVSGIVSRSGARLLLAGGEHKGRRLGDEAAAMAAGLDGLRVLRRCGATNRWPGPDPGSTSWPSAAEYQARTVAVRPGDPCLLLYSSGTTGVPKGVLHSHRIVDNMIRAAQRLELSSSDTLVHYLPLAHIFGLATVLSFLHAGAKLVLIGGFDAARSLAAMHAERATVVYGIGTMYLDQLDEPALDRCDLSTVRLCLVSGSGDLVRAVAARIGPAVNVWGMTETCGISTLPSPGDPPELAADTNGRPLPQVEIRVVRPGGAVAPPGERGELQARGVGLMLGYFDDPGLTARSVVDGWLRTGDIARLRPDGYLEFLGRGKDVLRVGGEQVDPIEVERVLERHPAVLAAAVIGLQHARLGEVPFGFVTLVAGARLDVTELVDHARATLAGFKVPRQIVVLDRFPMTESGKIRKADLNPEQHLID